MGDRRRALALAAFLAVEEKEMSAFHAFEERGSGWINLLVQETRSLRAALDLAGGLDGAVEGGGEGVYEKSEHVRLEVHLGGYGCY